MKGETFFPNGCTYWCDGTVVVVITVNRQADGGGVACLYAGLMLRQTLFNVPWSPLHYIMSESWQIYLFFQTKFEWNSRDGRMGKYLISKDEVT